VIRNLPAAGTATIRNATTRSAIGRNGVLGAAVLCAALAAAVAVRVAIGGQTVRDGMAAGAVFGVALIAVALRFGGRIGLPRAASVATGIVGGIVLVGLPGWLDPLPVQGLGLHPQPFIAWALVTVIVASGEEAILRGVLFDALAASLGRPGAVVLTSLAFALLHVPLYGWHVVPLDLAVGVWLAGLRLVSGTIAAPAAAHALADLATWWM